MTQIVQLRSAAMSDPKANERAQLRLIAAGDERAFSEYVRLKARYFYAVVYRITLSRATAEDVVQNAFMKLWEKRETLDVVNGNLSAWLYRVVFNLAVDDKRRLKFAEVPENITSGDDVHENLAVKEESAALHKGLAGLPPRQRAAIALVYYDEMPQKEAAEVMGINLKALESLLSRGKEALRKSFEESA